MFFKVMGEKGDEVQLPGFHPREDAERDLILTGALEIYFLDMVKWRREEEKTYARLIKASR